MTRVAFETEEDTVEFDTVEFAGFFGTPSATCRTKTFHSIPFKQFRCFKDNKMSSFWNLDIDGKIYRRVISGSIKIINGKYDSE